MEAVSILVAVGTGLLAFVGALTGSLLSRRGAKELDQWRRREETMRMLRWAVDSASSDNDTLAEAGLEVLEELIEAELLQSEDRHMVEAVTAVVTRAVRSMAYADYGDEEYSQAQVRKVGEEGDDG